LSNCAPDRIPGQSGAPRPIVHIRGADPDTGRMFTTPLLLAGGFGARADKDGIASLSFPTNTASVPIEMAESTNPVLFEEKELVTDSGGPGRFRGGLAQRMSIRSLAERLDVFIHAGGLTRSARGVQGGGKATGTHVELNGRRLRRVSSGGMVLRKGDVLTVQSPGGGGYGYPKRRDPALVQADVRRGYVSREQAHRVYGWQSETNKGPTL
jgi:N-methylhydantoinase B